jgi:hypothetical protein
MFPLSTSVKKVENGISVFPAIDPGFWKRLYKPKTSRTITPHIIKLRKFIV